MRDNASPGIIAETSSFAQNCVRLYFRPKTPTFYSNEGFRPQGRLHLGSHCAAPVALLFNLRKVLARSDVRISDGNMRKWNTRTSAGIGFLESLDFRDIYHDESLAWPDKERIKNARHTEVLVPERLGLEYLEIVYARSIAESQLINSLLADLSARARASTRHVHFGVYPPYFFREWPYIKVVRREADDLRVCFNQNKPGTVRGPFHLRVDLRGGAHHEYLENMCYFAEPILEIQLGERWRKEKLAIEIKLDNCLAYMHILD